MPSSPNTERGQLDHLASNLKVSPPRRNSGAELGRSQSFSSLRRALHDWQDRVLARTTRVAYLRIRLTDGAAAKVQG